LFALLNGAMRSLFALVQSEDHDAFQVFNLFADDFQRVHHIIELIALKLQGFTHRGWKFFSSFSSGGQFLLGFGSVFKGSSGKLGQGFHSCFRFSQLPEPGNSRNTKCFIW
jgi:hypothetical protein